VLDDVDGDVRREVVDAVDRLAEADRERLGRGDPDEEAPASPDRRHRDGVEVAQLDSCLTAGALDRRHHGLEVGSARDLGDDAAEAACSSTLLATVSTRRVCPRTMPTPVSSQDVSMPRTRGSSLMRLPS
jgi:hypothetical protein